MRESNHFKDWVFHDHPHTLPWCGITQGTCALRDRVLPASADSYHDRACGVGTPGCVTARYRLFSAGFSLRKIKLNYQSYIYRTTLDFELVCCRVRTYNVYVHTTHIQRICTVSRCRVHSTTYILRPSRVVSTDTMAQSFTATMQHLHCLPPFF